MKQYLLIVISLFLFCKNGFSQEVEACEKIVDIVIESINEQSTDNLMEHLSNDFTIAGTEGEIAKMVLSQLLSQLGETVVTYEKDKEIKVDEGLSLTYQVEFAKMGAKESTFIFNNNNQLKELSLFKMEVKTMSNKAQVEKSMHDIIEVPFEMVGNLILVEVSLNGQSRKFILDSGSPKVVLNARYLSKDTEQRTMSSVKGVNGSISGLNIEKIESLNFYEIKLVNQEVITMDLAHLEKELEAEVHGLIGYELIKDYDLIFDYENQRLILLNPKDFENYKAKELKGNELEIVNIEMEGHIPVIDARVGGDNLKLGIDTGAESNLLDVSLFKNFNKLISNLTTDVLVGADKTTKEVKIAAVNSLEIGRKTFVKTETIFSDISHLNEAYKLKIDGLIGYPILSNQKTILSFYRKELIFVN